MTPLRGLWMASLLLGAAACHRAARPVEPTAALQSGADAAAIVAARDADTRTLRATFKLVVHRSDGSEEASRGAVVVARPDRLRLQVFSFGVVTTYDYTANGDRYRIREPLSGVQRIGRFDVAGDGGGVLGDDLRPLFLAATPGRGQTVRDGGDRYLVTSPSREGARIAEVSKGTGAIERETVFVGDIPRLAIEYGDFRDVDGVAMPFAIGVSLPGRIGSLAISITSYVRNAPVDDALFEF
jgi:hypothetical protein